MRRGPGSRSHVSSSNGRTPASTPRSRWRPRARSSRSPRPSHVDADRRGAADARAGRPAAARERRAGRAGAPGTGRIAPARAAPELRGRGHQGVTDARIVSPMMTPTLAVPEQEQARLARGEHHDPHSILGAHLSEGGTVVRAFHPDANSAALVAPNGGRAPMESDRQRPVGRLRPRPRARHVRLPDPVRLPRRQCVGARRPVSVRPDPRRGRPAPDRRGHPRAPV